MTKCKLILPILGIAALVGCVTTEQMPNGTTKIRFSDQTVSSLTSMMPDALVKGVAGGSGGSGGEGLNLVPSVSPLGTGELLYLNGQFDLECASALLYSAKSGRPMETRINNSCMSNYYVRQSQLRMAGKPFDREAPAYDSPTLQEGYWAKVVSRTVSQLAATNQFTTRFVGHPRVERDGQITMSVRLPGETQGVHVALATTPARTPVLLDDGQFELQVRQRAARTSGLIADSIACDAVLAYSKTVDRGPRPSGIATSAYSRYEVLFTVASMGCRDATRQFKTASRQM